MIFLKKPATGFISQKIISFTFKINHFREVQSTSPSDNKTKTPQELLLRNISIAKSETLQRKEPWIKVRWTNFFRYIEEISHLDEVRQTQTHVMSIKQDLQKASEQKRTILQKLEKVRFELGHIYKDMKFTNDRVSEQYLQLVKTELDLYTTEKDLQNAFKSADEKEQNLFQAFSEAINESYEKEKMHTNFLKILGIVGTIISAALTLTATIIGQLYHQNKLNTIRKDVEYSLSSQVYEKLNELNKRIQSIESQHNRIESWGSYINRHTRWMYSWAIPKN